MIFGLHVKKAGGSLSSKEANDVWESVESRSDQIRVEDHSIIDESMVDNAAR